MEKNCSLGAYHKLTRTQQFRVTTETACFKQYAVLTYSNYEVK